MSFTFLMYLWLKLDAILSIFAAMIFVYCGFRIIHWLSIVMETTWSEADRVSNEARMKEFTDKFWGRATKVIIAVFILAAVPNSNQTAVLVAASYAESAIQSQEGQKVVQLAKLKANKYLDEQIKSLTEDKSDKGNKDEKESKKENSKEYFKTS